MKVLLAFALLASSLTASAGTLLISVNGSKNLTGGELRFYRLEHVSGLPYLYLENKQGGVCRVPVAVLKNYGLDPLQTAHLLLTSEEPAPILVCSIPQVEISSTKIATDITFTSFIAP